MEEANTSGYGDDSIVPQEINKWNWGAFFFSWIWGLGNRTYLALLFFVPFLGFAMMVVLGVKGSEWAWRNKKWDSVEHFQRVQRKWAIAAITFTIAMILGVAALVSAVFYYMKTTEPYLTSFEMISSDSNVIEAFGTPIESGFVSGKRSTKNSSGEASLSYSITGPNGSGKVYIDATNTRDLWTTDCLEVVLPDSSRRMVVDCKR